MHDLPQALAKVPNVGYYQGWETRSRSSGGYDKLLAIGIHHTGSNKSPADDMAYEWLYAPDKPIGAIHLARDGRITVGAAGATNTQGKGGPLTCSKGTIPLDAGNRYMLSIEAANSGTGEPWPKPQTDAYLLLVATLSDFYDLAVPDTFGHFDYCAPSCPSRKIDPAGPSPFGSVNSAGTWNIRTFRLAVDALTPVLPPPIPITEDDMRILQLWDIEGVPSFILSGYIASWIPTQELFDAYKNTYNITPEAADSSWMETCYILGALPPGTENMKVLGHSASLV